MPPLQLQKEPETGRKTVGIERGVDCIEYWLQAAERKSDQLRFELPRAEMEVIYFCLQKNELPAFRQKYLQRNKGTKGKNIEEAYFELCALF